MRPLLTATGVAGLLLGTAAAVAWHYAHVHAFGWFAYVPLAHQTHVRWAGASWFPAMLVGPVAGALLGLALGWLLARAGWRLTRG